MGAISKIRQLSPYALGVIAVLFIAFMVIQDSSCQSIQQQAQNPENVAIANVNGEMISLADYERRVAQAVESARAQGQQQQVNDAQVRQQVYEGMVDEILRRQAAEEMGVMVTRQELVDNILINPPADIQFFKDSLGNFQREMHEDLVTNPDKIITMMTDQGASLEEAEKQRDDWVKTLYQVEDYIRAQKLEAALRSAVGAAASIASVAQTEIAYEQANSFADIRYIAIPADLTSDDQAKPTEEELKAYYEANKQYYEQKPARKIKYVTYKQVPSEKDSARAQRRSIKLQETLAKYPEISKRDSIFSQEMAMYGGESNDWSDSTSVNPTMMVVLGSLKEGDVFGPLTMPNGIHYVRLDGRRDFVDEQVRASHILLAFGNDKDSSRREAEKIMAMAKGGIDFGALATQYSTDPGSAQNGGDLNFFGKGRMVPAFEQAAFAANVGDIVGPVETQFGWHIIKVTDRKGGSPVRQYKFSEITIKPVMSTATKQKIIADAAKFEQALEDGTPIDTLAAKEGVTVQESSLFTRGVPILGSPEVTAWSFNNSQGDVLRKDIDNYGIVVAQITETRQAGIQPYEDVEDRILREVTQAKKMDIIEGMANDIAGKIKSAGASGSHLRDQPDSRAALSDQPSEQRSTPGLWR